MTSPAAAHALAMPELSLLFASACAVLQVALTALVIARRASTNISFLDAGDGVLLRRIRAHGNLTETAPIAQLLMALLEVNGLDPAWLWTLGATLVLGRVVHAYGLLGDGANWARVAGTLATLGVIGVQAASAGWLLLVAR